MLIWLSSHGLALNWSPGLPSRLSLFRHRQKRRPPFTYSRSRSPSTLYAHFDPYCCLLLTCHQKRWPNHSIVTHGQSARRGESTQCFRTRLCTEIFSPALASQLWHLQPMLLRIMSLISQNQKSSRIIRWPRRCVTTKNFCNALTQTIGRTAVSRVVATHRMEPNGCTKNDGDKGWKETIPLACIPVLDLVTLLSDSHSYIMCNHFTKVTAERSVVVVAITPWSLVTVTIRSQCHPF